MAEKSKAKSLNRSMLAKKFIDLGELQRGLRIELSLLQVLLILGCSLVVTTLLMPYEFLTFPDYRLGDIADRTIEAPEDFTVVDEKATEEKRREAILSVPAVFVYDYRITSSVLSELRRGFAEGRELIAQEKQRLGRAANRKLPKKSLEALRSQLEEALPRFTDGRTLDVCLKYDFSEELENQLASLLTEAMKYPGVVGNRELLVSFRERGIALHNDVTGESRILADWLDLRDIQQAQDVLKQREYELTLVSGEEKKELLGFLEGWIVPNTAFDAETTTIDEQIASGEVDPVLIQVKKGKTIVRSGDDITEKELVQLAELKKQKNQEHWVGRTGGVFLIVCFFFLVLWLYFLLHQEESERKRSEFLLLVVVMVFSLLIARLFVGLGNLLAASPRFMTVQDPVDFYLFTPLALGAVLMILLLGVNASIFFSLVFALFMGLLTGEISILVYTLTGSLAAIYALRHYRERSAIVRAGLIIGAVNILVAFALQLYSSEASFRWLQFWIRTPGGLVSGLSSGMLAALFLPVLETLFGLTTDIRLLELSNLNSPILRRLALEAPGTYHHSITVGTLAEAGAEAIRANSLLTRVGAYYHDIGKIKHPDYYVENQVFSVNKHEALAPTMSSLILSAHVKDGLAMAEELGLGSKVRDLIPQHHGTRVMAFFYQKAKEIAEERSIEINQDDFRYPGPRPQTREAAILMLADQVEAAARTLQDPSPGQIRGLIQRITQSTIQDGQFDECDITIKDLTRVGLAFERVLTGMYHHRIEYPGFDFKQELEGRDPENQRIQ